MAIEDLWYKNAVIYCLPVEKYLDSNGDGVGDFEGLSRKLDYLTGLGVTCVWLPRDRPEAVRLPVVPGGRGGQRPQSE